MLITTERPRAKDEPRIDLNDPALPATLEVLYLRPLLEALPEAWQTAIDVGAHKGDVTEALSNLGYHVLALEPQEQLAGRIEQRLAGPVSSGRVVVARCAASDRAGRAELLVGRASTVSTLERDWTTVAFPEEFQSPRKVGIGLDTISSLRAAHDMGQVGFVKVDVEGHEPAALRGLFAGSDQPPLVVMFEANQRFAAQAAECLTLLRAQGYECFDIIIREGIEPIAVERFDGRSMPKAWARCDGGGRYFYANVIAYHGSLPEGVEPPDLDAFFQTYRVEAARRVLQEGLALEARSPVPVHPQWLAARSALREFLTTTSDWSTFLRNPVCKEMFVRGRWGAAQDFERAALEADPFGRRLLAVTADPPIGSPRPTDQLPSLSTNMLGMAYYLLRMHRLCGGALPGSVVEIGGGYGALAWLFAQHAPRASYVIIDLPEMLALQHYFLSRAMPRRRVNYASSAPVAVEPGSITLVPASMLGGCEPRADLLVSTFAYSEMPELLQAEVCGSDFFGARRIFLTGQLNTEAPHARWVDHGQVVAPLMQKFEKISVERFHVGDNYLLTAER